MRHILDGKACHIMQRINSTYHKEQVLHCVRDEITAFDGVAEARAALGGEQKLLHKLLHTPPNSYRFAKLFFVFSFSHTFSRELKRNRLYESGASERHGYSRTFVVST